MQNEIWKDIPDYIGYYQVSSLGRVKSTQKKKHLIIKPWDDGRGYLCVCLCKNKINKKFKVHKLVAMAFLNHKPNLGFKLVVDHINEIKHDNSVENLQIVTTRYNVSKSIKSAKSKYIGVVFDRNKWKAQIVIKGKLKNLGRFENEYDAHLVYQKKLKEIENE